LTGPVEITTIEPSEINASELEVVIVEDLGAKEYASAYNPPLIGTFSSPVVQFPLPRMDFTDSIPLHWASMDIISQVSGSGVPTTPT
jgi:hypothetical protein